MLISLRILFQSLSLWKMSFRIMHLFCDSIHLAALTLFCKSSYTHFLVMWVFHVLFQHKYLVVFLEGSLWQSNFTKIEVCLGSLSYCCGMNPYPQTSKPEGGVCLWRTNNLRVAKTSPDLNISTTTFHSAVSFCLLLLHLLLPQTWISSLVLLL